MLYNDDCMNVIPKITKEIDLILTDPPYGINYQSNRPKNGPRHKKLINDNSVFTNWLNIIFPKVRNGGGLLLFCGWKTSAAWQSAIEHAGFKIKSQVIWNRLHHGMGDLRGSFAPMHDIIWYATKGRRIFVNGRPKSVIECKRPSPSEDYEHPTCKPVKLLEALIKAVDDGNTKTVIDPFMGSGSTGQACLNLGLDFIGIELDQDYFKIAKRRISNVS